MSSINVSPIPVLNSLLLALQTIENPEFAPKTDLKTKIESNNSEDNISDNSNFLPVPMVTLFLKDMEFSCLFIH